MSIFITGDTHSKYVKRFNEYDFPIQNELTKDDYVIICGDFGGIWDTNQFKFEESESEKRDLDWLEARNFTTLFVPGNHENYDRLTGIKDEDLLNCWLYKDMPDEEKDKFRKGYPRIAWHNGYVRQIRPSVLMLENGIFNIDGKKIFVYGGAPSHDIQGGILYPSKFKTAEEFYIAYKYKMKYEYLPFRVHGISWWTQEEPDEEMEKAAVSTLIEHNWTVDFIITHDCSLSDRAMLGFKESSKKHCINTFLENVKDVATYSHWYFGHYHENIDMPGGKNHLLYKKIIQIN